MSEQREIFREKNKTGRDTKCKVLRQKDSYSLRNLEVRMAGIKQTRKNKRSEGFVIYFKSHFLI